MNHSPKLAMLLDGVLIPAEHLVNGVSVVQATSVERVDYFHIDLDSHDAIIAEGALSETFVDDDSRAMVHNAREFSALYPDAAPIEAIYCAPRVEEGFMLDAIRRRLAGRAGMGTRPAIPSDFRGTLDRVDAQGIEGWAQAIDRPDVPVCLDILVDGIVVAQTSPRISAKTCARPASARAGTASATHGISPWLVATTSSRSADRATAPASGARRKGCLWPAPRPEVERWQRVCAERQPAQLWTDLRHDRSRFDMRTVRRNKFVKRIS